MSNHRLLVIANETCPCPDLLEEVCQRARAEHGAEVLVVAPALNSRMKHWVSDTDGAVAEAEERVSSLVEDLNGSGVGARGRIGASEPLVAIEDALVDFPADELILATHPPESSHWLENGLLEGAAERFSGPVTHFVSRYGVEPGASAA